MCEFKIIRKNDGSQLTEDIVIVNYTQENEIIFKDILGMGEVLTSALILEVNTINQTLTVIEHPVIKDVIGLMNNLTNGDTAKEKIESIITQLNELKKSL